MKNYNKSFSVEITANMIAEKFMSNLDPKLSKDRAEKFTDAVIGPMCSNDNTHGLKHLYYGLFDLDMEAPKFKEEDRLTCAKSAYKYILTKNVDEDDVEAKWKQEFEGIGECKLIGFDPYKQHRKYEVSFVTNDSRGEEVTKTEWVDEDDLKQLDNI